ncbi:Aste57867_3640 [Aphanomyces stellatus]|uniref:Aste57867_3640 protein n=1 Tax=Aphanomyces stellatus TaxID=120398 RepID=A0A485KA30_9STRA|nr:hypothetical protein As57867_003629 [Aphanomyces stellatus]VFT80797.1 Aste57867_3640 [Aphanomyces stellatus]
MAIVFPSLFGQIQLHGVLRLVLASLVHHHDFLVGQLPVQHPLLSTPLFVSTDLVSTLRPLVFSGTESTLLFASGIPPHVELLRQLDRNEKSIQSIPSVVLNGVRQIVDERGLAAGNITQGFFESTLSQAIATALQRVRPDVPPTTAPTDDVDSNSAVFSWGGLFHMLPEDFKFPSVDLATAWNLWWRGNPAQKIIPFRKICTRDLSLPSEHKEYYEWKFIMEKMIAYYTAKQGSPPSPTASALELSASFAVANGLLDPIRTSTSTKRSRRDGQLRVSTAARLVRQMQPTTHPRPFRKRNKRAVET